MKVVNDPSMPGAYCEQQVVFYQSGLKDPLPGNMEEIKITIVNEQTTGSKRERDNVTAVTPCAKKSRSTGFSCSTPSSATNRLFAIQHSDFPDWHPQQEELDDSLLDLSDDEDDSELLLTLDEEDALLEEDDDDPCYAAEPSGKHNEMTICVFTFTPSVSEKECENGAASPSRTLNASNTLTELESEGNLSNYAAMPLSPCQSAIDPVVGIIPKRSSVCNVESCHEILTAQTLMDRDLLTPFSDDKNVPGSRLPRPGSPTLLHASLSLSRVDAAVVWVEDTDFAFDSDIDNLLAINPGAVISSEEDIISDSTLPPHNIESDQVLTANATFSSSSDAAQYVPPLSLNIAGLSNVHHPHPAELKPSTTSSIITSEPKPSTESSGTEQNLECQKPSGAEGPKGMLNVESTSRPIDPSQSAAPGGNGNQSKIVVSDCKAQCSLDPEKEKPLIAVAPLPRTSFRAFLSDFELERNKEIYCRQVYMHIDGQGQCYLQDSLNELDSLMNQINRENQSWQHPSNFTKRNHPRFGKKTSKRCALKQWVADNGGPNERFKNFPDTFQRSPIPDALLFSS